MVTIRAYAYDKALETIDRNEARGLKVPNLYIRRRMVIVITAYDKAHKLRDGAVCRNCKSDLTIENWAVGCGNICKSCMKEYNKVCGHGDNKKSC